MYSVVQLISYIFFIKVAVIRFCILYFGKIQSTRAIFFLSVPNKFTLIKIILISCNGNLRRIAISIATMVWLN